MGWNAEQWSWSTPGTVSSLLLVPPPMWSAASSTSTSMPCWARRTAAASPLGPEPTTTAVAITALRQRRAATRGDGGDRWRRCVDTIVRRAGPGDVQRDRAVGEPRQLVDGVGDLVAAPLDDAEGGVDHLVLLAVLVDRLRFDPGHEELAGLEVAALLDGLDELLVVEVAVAEVEPDDRVAARTRPRAASRCRCRRRGA